MRESEFEELMAESGPSEMEASGYSQWAVPWADLMMVMFVLFVVLFVYATTHRDVTVLFRPAVGAEQGARREPDPLHGLIGRIAMHRPSAGDRRSGLSVEDNEVLYRSGDEGITILRESHGTLRVILQGGLFFEPGQPELNPEAASYLVEVAELARMNAGAVHVVGYADQAEAAGRASFDLSTARAGAVAAFLMDRAGLAPERFVVAGMGAYQPEVPSNSEDNAARNRRVELYILNQS